MTLLYPSLGWGVRREGKYTEREGGGGRVFSLSSFHIYLEIYIFIFGLGVNGSFFAYPSPLSTACQLIESGIDGFGGFFCVWGGAPTPAIKVKKWDPPPPKMDFWRSHFGKMNIYVKPGGGRRARHFFLLLSSKMSIVCFPFLPSLCESKKKKSGIVTPKSPDREK